MKIRKNRVWNLGFLLFFACAPLNAYDDEWRSKGHAFKARVQDSAPYRFSREALEGSVRGDFIKQPTLANILGNLTINFTPAAVYADTRDILANVQKSWQTGFREYKKDVALASIGAVPVLGEFRKIGKAVELGKSNYRQAKILREVGDLSLVRKTLPDLPDYVRKSFDGEIQMRTFKKGDVLYRSPREAESAFVPGRFLGTRAAVTSHGADSLYHMKTHGNDVKLLRSYEFKQAVSLPYGKVKNGTWYQVYVPEDIDTAKIFKWTGVRSLR